MASCHRSKRPVSGPWRNWRVWQQSWSVAEAEGFLSWLLTWLFWMVIYDYNIFYNLFPQFQMNHLKHSCFCWPVNNLIMQLSHNNEESNIIYSPHTWIPILKIFSFKTTNLMGVLCSKLLHLTCFQLFILMRYMVQAMFMIRKYK